MRAMPKDRSFGVLYATIAIGLYSLPYCAWTQEQAKASVFVERTMMHYVQHLRSLDRDASEDAVTLNNAVKTHIAPHIGFDTLARSFAGNAWQSATQDERTAFRAALHDYIVGSYAFMLSRAKDAIIRVDPSTKELTKRSVVRAHISLAQASDNILDFRMLYDGLRWKIIDISVDGVSLARSLRSEIHRVVNDGTLADGVRYFRER